MHKATRKTQWRQSTNVRLCIIRLRTLGMTTAHCPKSTSCRATFPRTKVVSKSIRITANSIEITVDKMIPEFNKGAEKYDHTWVDSFSEFENALQGQHRIAWKQVLHEHFPEPINATIPVPIAHDCNSGENFHQALQHFLQ
jgi:hypothetical protein